jgi:hypothetical protein
MPDATWQKWFAVASEMKVHFDTVMIKEGG